MARQWPSGHPCSACPLLAPLTLFPPPIGKPWPHVQTGRGEPSGALGRRLQAQTPDVQPFNSGRHLFQVILESKTGLTSSWSPRPCNPDAKGCSWGCGLWVPILHLVNGNVCKSWKARMLCLNAVYLGGEENSPIFVIKKRKLEMCWCL